MMNNGRSTEQSLRHLFVHFFHIKVAITSLFLTGRSPNLKSMFIIGITGWLISIQYQKSKVKVTVSRVKLWQSSYCMWLDVLAMIKFWKTCIVSYCTHYPIFTWNQGYHLVKLETPVDYDPNVKLALSQVGNLHVCLHQVSLSMMGMEHDEHDAHMTPERHEISQMVKSRMQSLGLPMTDYGRSKSELWDYVRASELCGYGRTSFQNSRRKFSNSELSPNTLCLTKSSGWEVGGPQGLRNPPGTVTKYK